MENRKRNIQMKFYVTEEEKRLIDEKMKQLPIKQYGAYFRKMAIDGYILVVDRSDTKAYIRELQAVSRNINQIAKRANATGTVYRQDMPAFHPAGVVPTCVAISPTSVFTLSNSPERLESIPSVKMPRNQSSIIPIFLIC